MHLANGIEAAHVSLGPSTPLKDDKDLSKVSENSALHRHLHHQPIKIVGSRGNYLITADGREIFDATAGAAVSCIGHGDVRVKEAMMAQIDEVAYCYSLYFTSTPNEKLSDFLAASTGYQMTKVFIVGSGAEAVESAIKLARQYFMELPEPQPQRTRFISRRQAYHGNTLGALSVGGHVQRRAIYEPILTQNVSLVSPCYPYRDMGANETEEQYVERLKQELEDEFQRVGPDTVCAFIAESMSGATLGCVPPSPGYWKAVRQVCDRHGALMIMDEVMAGMGRTGSYHAWEQEDVVPDLQTIGKGLGAGYAPIAALLINKRVVEALDKGTGAFVHGQTYQAHPVACAAALKVQQIVNEENLVENCRLIGEYLGQRLHERLDNHPNVGEIRGRGLFWAIEIVKDQKTKEPFPGKMSLAWKLHSAGLRSEFCISLMPGPGTVDGFNGDHIILAPPYNITREDVEIIVDRTARVMEDVLADQSGH